jgi:hypothetical protein
MDAGAGRRTQQHFHDVALCPPVQGRRAHRKGGFGRKVGRSSRSDRISRRRAAETGEKAVGQAHSEISDQDLQRLLATCDYVVVGRITDVHPWAIPKSAASRYRTSEHSANWQEAVLQVQSVLKGPKLKRNKMVVRFPLSRDVAWVSAPKFVPGQQGIFILQKDEVSGTPTSSAGGYKADVYTCLKPGDWLPMTEEARVRSLLENR